MRTTIKIDLELLGGDTSWKAIEELISGIDGFCSKRGYVLIKSGKLITNISTDDFITEEDLE